MHGKVTSKWETSKVLQVVRKVTGKSIIWKSVDDDSAPTIVEIWSDETPLTQGDLDKLGKTPGLDVERMLRHDDHGVIVVEGVTLGRDVYTPD